MTVPPEATSDVVTSHGLVACDDVLDGSGKDVAVVGQAGGEGWAVVEDVFGEVRGFGELGLESVDLGPEGEDGFFLGGEGEILAFANVVHGGIELIRLEWWWRLGFSQRTDDLCW